MIAFADYLEAKIALDDRSFNEDVFEALRDRLNNKRHVRGLDVGTGSGAMIWRILSTSVNPSMSWTGIDTDKSLLSLAAKQLRQNFRSQGCQPEHGDHLIRGRVGARSVTVAFEQSTVADYRIETNGPEFDLITAHAVMDLLPMADAIGQFYAWLKKDGLFYATINYNGKTTIRPDYANAQFEARLLQFYNESMERRRSDEHPTGGAFSGQRLRAMLARTDFEIIASGAADWDITPLDGGYREDGKTCIQALVDMIWEEGKQCAELDQKQLGVWYADRCRHIENEQLALYVHNLDILAVKRA